MADTPEHLKAVVISNNFYTVFYEQYRNLTFIHMDMVDTYRPTIKSLMLADLRTLMDLRDTPLFALHNPDDNKHRKFLKLMGFNFLQTVDCHDKTQKEIYIKNKD